MGSEWLRWLTAFVFASALAGCGSSNDDNGDPSNTGATGGSSGSSGNGGTAGSAGVGASAGTGATGGTPEKCPSEPPSTSALAFDGVDDSVSMGVASSLGLAELTIEAWVRRDGPGKATGTGVGGISLVPIAGKGRGESDGSNVDCNYAFGFVGDVLGADFEDTDTGKNHPIMGKTAIPLGQWHHVAASYDGTTWRLYVDGQLDAVLDANATPRDDSIQYFGVGAAFDSKGTAAGALHGAVDELRVWNIARTQSEIADSMYRTLPSAPGLVGRWAFDKADGGAPDSVGANDGTISGASFAEPGAVLDQGLPPAIELSAPADQASVTGSSIDLKANVTDPEGDPLLVSFHVREIAADDDFTIVVLPDTQHYTIQGNGNEQYYYDQTKWIMANREAYNIVSVFHNGDIVEHGDDYEYEWKVADTAMKTLEVTSTALPDGLPYAITVGNHDEEPIGTYGSTAMFNKYFGVSRFQGRSYYGGHRGTTNDEHWITFSAGGLEFVVVDIAYDTTQDPAVTAWARTILSSHPNAFGIVNSHFIVTLLGGFGAQGQAIYDALRDVDNLQLMTCGHVPGEARRSDTYEGHTIHSMLADYQSRANGGNGWLRVWEFSPANNELTVRTYSPSLDQWETDDNSEYTLPVDLTGAGGSFEPLAAVEPVAGVASAKLSPLTAGHTYEWYVEAHDCAHTVTSPIRQFSVAP